MALQLAKPTAGQGPLGLSERKGEQAGNFRLQAQLYMSCQVHEFSLYVKNLATAFEMHA